MKWYAENFVTTLQLSTIFLLRLSSHSLFMQQTNVHKLARIEKKTELKRWTPLFVASLFKLMADFVGFSLWVFEFFGLKASVNFNYELRYTLLMHNFYPSQR